MIGGSVGYSVRPNYATPDCTEALTVPIAQVYYNVFVSKFVPKAVAHIGGYMIQIGITNETIIGEAIQLTADSLVDRIADLPGVAGVPGAHEAISK